MKFTAILSSLFVLSLSTFTLADSLSYDENYDNKSGSLDTTACSDGSNGLASSYPTFGDLPKFPYIGGAAAIKAWNSPNCGTCWKLTYTNDKKKSKSINVLAVDVADDGFNISLEAMNALTNNLATELGRIDVKSEQVAASKCGL
jgi:hypothetical protein